MTGDAPRVPDSRPPLECDCHICRDDTVTVCLEEAHRLLQIDYEDQP